MHSRNMDVCYLIDEVLGEREEGIKLHLIPHNIGGMEVIIHYSHVWDIKFRYPVIKQSDYCNWGYAYQVYGRLSQTAKDNGWVYWRGLCPDE